MKIMRQVSKVMIGKYYRLRTSPSYGYLKVIEKIKPGTPVEGKKYTHWLIKCEHTVNKEDTCGFIRYFRVDDMVEDES